MLNRQMPWFPREKPTDFPQPEETVFLPSSLSLKSLPAWSCVRLAMWRRNRTDWRKETCRETVSQITEKINRQWPRYDRRRFLAIASRIPSTFFFSFTFSSCVCARVCVCNYARIRNRKRVTILIDKLIASASDERTNIDQRGIISLHKPSDRLPDARSKLF